MNASANHSEETQTIETFVALSAMLLGVCTLSFNALFCFILRRSYITNDKNAYLLLTMLGYVGLTHGFHCVVVQAIRSIGLLQNVSTEVCFISLSPSGFLFGTFVMIFLIFGIERAFTAIGSNQLSNRAVKVMCLFACSVVFVAVVIGRYFNLSDFTVSHCHIAMKRNPGSIAFLLVIILASTSLVFVRSRAIKDMEQYVSRDKDLTLEDRVRIDRNLDLTRSNYYALPLCLIGVSPPLIVSLFGAETLRIKTLKTALIAELAFVHLPISVVIAGLPIIFMLKTEGLRMRFLYHAKNRVDPVVSIEAGSDRVAAVRGMYESWEVAFTAKHGRFSKIN